ncbi:aminotransferase class I/II-fold pyridoxal phosphate-dependent enzyme [Streptomyces sp. ACA25]|uniref:aminotransferase class I/II-fold pyridoxal phosphate-dependent enzyme n=1 Tax=Streptomyces sp. ACA25 TaxID=3022596 RepID=UPI002306F079|nr:aminotransferase class I/II-fold pyridoxal phosphate-dependent enzyme [Streptomyces sp. ACA25]MDB1088329.1 aminotransferase class I/II-fold pyridoxal phosphate-dependent enzyme [Streptomyces sp. ACA25]
MSRHPTLPRAPGVTTSSPGTGAEQVTPWRPGIVQAVAPPGVQDLGPGYLAPELLPVDLLRQAYGRALDVYGPAALAYGHDPGADPLRELLARRAAGEDGEPCGPEHVVITAGTSQALFLLATAVASPGDAVVVEQSCYDYGQDILRDCGLALYRAETDSSGITPHGLQAALAEAGRDGRRGAFLYLNPTFHNPTGRTIPVARRRELLAVTGQCGLLIVEDDAYAELDLTGEGRPPSFAALSGYHGVVRLCTFAKTLAPGLRLGWLLSDPATADRLARHALFRSGGSLNHTTAMAVGMLLDGGAYDGHLAFLRERLRLRRDTLAAALRDSVGSAVEFTVPAGGFFLWLRPRGDRPEAGLLAAAEDAGVRVAAGSRFGPMSRPRLRVAYSLTSPTGLQEAAGRLAEAWGPRSTTDNRR